MAAVDLPAFKIYSHTLIPDEDLYLGGIEEDGDKYGREDELHVTVRYGLDPSVSFAQVADLLRAVPPFWIELGTISLFPADGKKPYDVVKVDVECPELHELNKLLREQLPGTDTYPVYVPHLTLAYVLAGRGARYAGDATYRGASAQVNQIIWAGPGWRNRKKVIQLRPRSSVTWDIGLADGLSPVATGQAGRLHKENMPTFAETVSNLVQGRDITAAIDALAMPEGCATSVYSFRGWRKAETFVQAVTSLPGVRLLDRVTRRGKHSVVLAFPSSAHERLSLIRQEVIEDGEAGAAFSAIDWKEPPLAEPEPEEKSEAEEIRKSGAAEETTTSGSVGSKPDTHLGGNPPGFRAKELGAKGRKRKKKRSKSQRAVEATCTPCDPGTKSKADEADAGIFGKIPLRVTDLIPIETQVEIGMKAPFASFDHQNMLLYVEPRDLVRVEVILGDAGVDFHRADRLPPEPVPNHPPEEEYLAGDPAAGLAGGGAWIPEGELLEAVLDLAEGRPQQAADKIAKKLLAAARRLGSAGAEAMRELWDNLRSRVAKEVKKADAPEDLYDTDFTAGLRHALKDIRILAPIAVALFALKGLLTIGVLELIARQFGTSILPHKLKGSFDDWRLGRSGKYRRGGKIVTGPARDRQIEAWVAGLPAGEKKIQERWRETHVDLVLLLERSGIEKKLLRSVEAGDFEIRKEVWNPGTRPEDEMEMESAYSKQDGSYIGDVPLVRRMVKKFGITRFFRAQEDHDVASIGWSPKEGKWYGWSHRAICGFQPGDRVKEGDLTATSGWTDEYLEEHPEADVSLPVGFRARSRQDAKKMAIAFAGAVS